VLPYRGHGTDPRGVAGVLPSPALIIYSTVQYSTAHQSMVHLRTAQGISGEGDAL
jgi:hypothetical protein